MGSGCPRCGEAPTVGVLCGGCAAMIAPGGGLLPEHVRAIAARGEAAAWLVDGFGAPHPIRARAVIGRVAGADLVVLDDSVSRAHAEVVRGDGGWQLRDLGSRNGTQLDGQRIAGRAQLARRAVVRFGDVAFLFVGEPAPLGDAAVRSVETAHASGAGAFRFTLRGDRVELCLVGARGDAEGGGGLLHRVVGSGAWSELSLPPLEFQLLRALCDRAGDEAEAPARVRGCVPTKKLAKDLPFQSRYANEENVRQVVRRLRASLADIGADGLIEAVPGRGYYLTWRLVEA
ncbi:MAG TPA: FHA domain-containing protein [Kofleriaceae bacterium]|jgi:hypothetical protein|nr:FHA domain-containing protein [Kofleriaceae bacterium]